MLAVCNVTSSATARKSARRKVLRMRSPCLWLYSAIVSARIPPRLRVTCYSYEFSRTRAAAAALPHSRQGGGRRYGSRLQGGRYETRPACGVEVASARILRRSKSQAAGPRGSTGGFGTQPSKHRYDLRHRRGRRFRLHRDGVCRRRNADLTSRAKWCFTIVVVARRWYSDRRRAARDRKSTR